MYLKKKDWYISPSLYNVYAIIHSGMIVNPKLDATLLNVISVVEPDGTYIVLVVPAFLVAKKSAILTFGELIWIVKLFKRNHILKTPQKEKYLLILKIMKKVF